MLSSRIAHTILASVHPGLLNSGFVCLFLRASGWVGFNIAQPLFTQLGRMTEMQAEGSAPVAKSAKSAKKAVKRSLAAIVGLSAVCSMLMAETANAATEVAQLAETDNRILVLATVFVPVVGWVGFNIAQPLFSQFLRMNDKAEVKAAAAKKAAPPIKNKILAPVKKILPKKK